MILKLKCVKVIKTDLNETAIFKQEEGKPGKKLTEVAGKLSFGAEVSITITDENKMGIYEQDFVYNIETISSPTKTDYNFPKKEA